MTLKQSQSIRQRYNQLRRYVPLCVNGRDLAIIVDSQSANQRRAQPTMCPGNKMIIYTLLLSYIPFTIATPFQSFYPHYAQTLSNLSENVCSETLALMEGVNYSPDNAPPQADRLDYCYGHENCMLANLPAAYLANYQAASVIMGLTPTILASLGPSVAETSLLSAHRPLLSFLISLGAPAVYPARVFEFTDPYSVLRHKEHLLRLPLWGTRSAIICSVLEYFFAVAAATTIISTSVQLGAKTILVWNCTNQAMPLVWTFLSAAIHIGAALSYKIALNSSDQRHNHGYQPNNVGGSETSAQKGTLRRISGLLRNEFRICALRKHLHARELEDPPRMAVLLNCLSGLGGFWHVVFGTVIFSALAFISIIDFLNYVFWRYILAAAVCRLVLMIELTGLRAVQREFEQQAKGVNTLNTNSEVK